LKIFILCEMLAATSTQLVDEFEKRYGKTYYSATLKEPMKRRHRVGDDALAGELRANVCIVGGGLAGLCTALSLAERGHSDVIVLEAEEVGWGASGRNGGFAVGGLAVEPEDMIDDLGARDAALLWRGVAEHGGKLLRARIDRYDIKCDVDDCGALDLSQFDEDADDMRRVIVDVNETMGSAYEFWSRERVRQVYAGCDRYHFGVFDPSVFSVNPLGLVLGLARAAEERGVRVFERSAVGRIIEGGDDDGEYRFRVELEDGSAVRCNEIVLAGSAHLDARVDFWVARSVVPVYTYIGVTEPLSDEHMASIVAPDEPKYCVCDALFALNYYRPLPGNRLLWGGFCQTYEANADALPEQVMALAREYYPQLEGVRAEFAWGGRIGFGREWYPTIGRSAPHRYYITGLGGHGVVPSSFIGELVANEIVAQASDDDDDKAKQLALMFATMQRHFPLRYAGWPFDRVAAQLVYWFLQSLDAFNLASN
jgi:gamma-glutamylputrescine oxidase